MLLERHLGVRQERDLIVHSDPVGFVPLNVLGGCPQPVREVGTYAAQAGEIERALPLKDLRERDVRLTASAFGTPRRGFAKAIALSWRSSAAT